MLCLSWLITVGRNIIADKFKTLWKDMALFETQQETVCPAHSQLTFHIKKGNIDGGAVVDNVVDNYSRVGIAAQGDVHGGC